MAFVRQNVPAITLPQVYAYEGPGSKLAADAGAVYMLLEGFYGNTLQDVEPDLCSLSVGGAPVIDLSILTCQLTGSRLQAKSIS